MSLSRPLGATLHSTLVLLATFVMVAAWLVPNHYLPWLSFYNEGCMALSLALFATATLLRREAHYTLPLLALFIVSLVAIPWMHFAVGLISFSGDAWVSSLYLLGFAVAVVIGNQWSGVKSESLAVLLSTALVAGAVLSSLLGMAQSLNGGALGIWSVDGRVGMPALGNLGQQNNLATLIGFGSVGLMLLRERGIVSREFSLCILSVLLVGAGLTQSRTALLFGPVILFGLLFFAIRHPGEIKTRLTTVLFATVFHWLIAFVWPVLQEALLISGPVTIVDRGLKTSRYQAWLMFVESLKDAPWTGYGWLQAPKAFYEVADRFPPFGELYMEAHNLFVELLVWCGYPVGLFLCSAVLYWFVSRALRISSLELMCAFLSLCLLGVHSMLELPYHYAYFLIPAGLLIGQIERALGAQSRLSPKWGFAVMAIAGLLFSGVVRDYLVVEDDFRLARFEYLRIGHLRADRLSPDAPFLSGLTAYTRLLRSPPRVGMDQSQLVEMREVVKRFPFSHNLMNFSFALALNGETAEARKVFLKIRHLHGDYRYQAVKAHLLERIAQEQDSRGAEGLLALHKSLPR